MARSTASTLHVEQIRLNNGGYDRQGRYWGVGQKLYRVTNEDGSVDKAVRAANAKEARMYVANLINRAEQYPILRNEMNYRGGHVRGLRGIGAPPSQAGCAQTMRLVYLPPNQAFAFKFGDSLIRLNNEPMFYATRAAATAAAARNGLQVDGRGCVGTPIELRYPEPRAN